MLAAQGQPVELSDAQRNLIRYVYGREILILGPELAAYLALLHTRDAALPLALEQMQLRHRDFKMALQGQASTMRLN